MRLCTRSSHPTACCSEAGVEHVATRQAFHDHLTFIHNATVMEVKAGYLQLLSS